ncbi:MAG TPA: carboxypeptidase regulatory-like domain-containing protein [Candidatus Saccharimonadales bacterium]|nr:carboxypeptidase regulatory-like domain-containing protein [Candidatus Saccharimonadales bacterium]
MRFWRTDTVALVMILALAAFAGPLLAQAPSGKLHGQVTDPSGAVIPGAAISVKNDSGLSLGAKSDGAGGYEVRNLAPGKYTISVKAKGFTPLSQQVEVSAGQLKLDIALEIQVKEEAVDVNADAARVSTNPDSNASSLVISGKDLDALSDDPDELQSELQALAGPSAGPNGGQIYIDGFTGGQLPPKSSIREIRINQNPFSAQYDRMGFGRIEVLTKPGSDKLHGQVSYNDNHSFLDALNPFAASEPDFSTESVRGNVGGPLSKKASYQVSVEQRNIHDAAVVVPSAFAAAGVPVVPVLNPRIRTNASVRFDYQLSASNTLTVRYQLTHNREENNGIGQLSLPSQAFNQSSTEHTIQVSNTKILGPTAVNETRFEWERNGSRQNSLTTAPSINVLGVFTAGGNPLGVNSIATNHYELQNYTSIAHGKHFMRMGGRLRATAETSLSTRNFNGTYIFDSLAAFQNATPRQLNITAGNPLIADTHVDAGLYAEDDWKLRPNMTLSYGLRFETQNGIQDHADWAPRVSFAWGVGAKKNAAPKTVIRTGFGIFYDRFGQDLVLQTKLLNGLNQQLFVIKDPSYPDPPALGGLPASASSTYSIDPALRAPYIMQGAASVERQLTKSATLSATYLHSQGVHQFSSVDSSLLNALRLGTFNPANPPAPANLYTSEGVFKQDQLITSFNVRAGARLSLFGFYVLSYANSDTSGAGSFPSNPALGIAIDYGRASYDVRNRVFLGGTIALPHGFRASPFLVANSGSPFNITTGTDLNGDFQFNDRPAFATDLSRPSVVRTSLGAFDTVPIAGQTIVPNNFGDGPSQFTLNLRLSKTIGLGPKLEASNNGNPQQKGGPGGDEKGRGGPGGFPGGGRPGGGPRGGGPRGGGPGGPFGDGGVERSSQRYSLTFSANARNLFNNVNPATPIGNLNSRLFNQSTALAGGVFNTQSANRRIDLQVGFSF